jgi:uncharacterized Zn-binding protein involved in type VI secretion
MPAVSRLGDLSVGVDGPPTVSIQSSINVFANSKGVCRVGDAWAPHPVGPHGRVVSAGSPNVYVNSKAVARVGDPLSCGDVIAQGSPSVFSNG